MSWVTGAGNGATITPNGGDTGKTLFFPNSGRRSYTDGGAFDYGEQGRFWSADQVQSGATLAWYLLFSSGGYSSGRITNITKITANYIRCVRS